MELISDGTEFEIKTIPGIMYETKERAGKFWRVLIYKDRGRIVLTNRALIFYGKKVHVRVQNIQNISRQKIGYKPMGGKGYIRIDYINETGGPDAVYFLKQALWVWELAKTDVLYGELLEWYKSIASGGGSDMSNMPGDNIPFTLIK
ncbi:MAG: hypothetical protein QF682_01400 [Candidatus Thermoplasmatota archaeon]|jgi:hypothetical protein|nr:hypothetical protein [Candidatus Thermoplasmatota archaeon]